MALPPGYFFEAARFSPRLSHLASGLREAGQSQSRDRYLWMRDSTRHICGKCGDNAGNSSGRFGGIVSGFRNRNPSKAFRSRHKVLPAD
jgi:hypothetical protein